MRESGSWYVPAGVAAENGREMVQVFWGWRGVEQELRAVVISEVRGAGWTVAVATCTVWSERFATCAEQALCVPAIRVEGQVMGERVS